MPCEPTTTTVDERLIVLAKAIAPDIAANVSGASECEYGFAVADVDDLQIVVMPMDQVEEPEDRDGGFTRHYVLWVMVREAVTHTDVDGLTADGNLVLRISRRYPVNRDLGSLSPPVSGFSGCIVDEKQHFPFYDQKELEKDIFQSVLLIRFHEHL